MTLQKAFETLRAGNIISIITAIIISGVFSFEETGS